MAGAMAILFCFMLIRPAETLEISDPEQPSQPAETTEPTQLPQTGEPDESQAAGTDPAQTQTDPTETEAAQTDPLETEAAQTDPLEAEPPQTESAETEPLMAIAEETEAATEPVPNAGAQEGDLSPVSGQGISFRLFNYSTDINKAAGGASWRPISQYFAFRNSKLEVGTDPSVVNIPSPNINAAHDQDGFTAAHATVERVLQGGFPVLDLTRNADGTARTDPGVSSSVRSLAYLFSAGDHAVTAYRPANTILQKNGNHYWYNSASHAVDYDVTANRFRLRSYAERNSTTAGYGTAYGDFLPFTYTGGEVLGTTDDGAPYHVLNADTDYWFGMTMQVNFFQTKGGKLEDQDMIFSFSGDDDVWVFVDDVLVLDLGGTHGTVDGSINFATGEVRQYLSWGGANTSETARADGSTTSFPTTLRACFDAAGREPNGGWSSDGKTFSSYTEHTLKFFYLERGAAVANCMLDFRLPTLPDESLTVTKDLTADSDSGVRDYVAESFEYRFRVMKADEAGNATDSLFITAGTTYDLLENGTKIGTGTVDETGCFSLKAGQSAQFTAMLRKGGGATDYVVEEIMPDGLVGQYSGVEFEVSGAGGDAKTEENPTEAFTAFSSNVLSAEQTQVVTFRNRVDTEKLGTLMITKLAAAGTEIPADALFQLQVTLGDSLLAAGTPYTAGGETRTVEERGIILLRAGETAQLEQGILSGTTYEIVELNADENGYRPTYSGTVQPEGTVESTENGASGVFPLGATVHVTVTNADYDFAVRIPVSKQVLDIQKRDTFSILAEQVVLEDGVWNVIESAGGTRITVDSAQQVTGYITIGYQAGTEGIFYYRVREQGGSGDYIYDTSAFLVEVTVSSGAATLGRIWKPDGTDVDAIKFINRATTRLTVTKTVTGGTGAVKFPFTVAVLLDGEPFQMQQPAAGAAYSADGNLLTFSLGHGDAITIPQIPIGATVTVTELNYDGFIVSSMIAGIDDSQETGNQREIRFGNSPVTVHVTNQTSFRLPDTGGGGSSMYTTGGAALCSAFGAALLYSHLRRKEEDASS